MPLDSYISGPEWKKGFLFIGKKKYLKVRLAGVGGGVR